MREIVTSFLKIGLTAYGGPAILGMMQAGLQERRQWIGKPPFVEGLASVRRRVVTAIGFLTNFQGEQRP